MDSFDFATVDSQAKAEEMVKSGRLEKILLLPLQFGGQDDPQNVVYVPVGVGAIKAGIDCNIIGPLASEGKLTQYKAVPEYYCRSFVPIAIKITAWDPGDFSTTVGVWGGEAAKG